MACKIASIKFLEANRVCTTFLILVLSLLFNSCKHDNFKDFVGPGHCPSPSFALVSPFTITAQATPTITLSSTPIEMTASFNEVVEWTLSIKGNTSGAQRTFTNKSSSVNVTWRGEPGSEKFFQTETVTIEFKIACQDASIYSRDITANSFNSYASTGKGLLLSDFDGNGPVANTFLKPGYNASGWSSYFTLPNEITEFGRVATPLIAPQGSNYMVLKGLPASNSWYVGGGYASVPNLATIAGATSDPTKMYVNAFINNGGNTSTLLGLTIKSGGVNYSKNVLLNWSGWKMVSYNLSEFETKRGIALSDALTVTDLTFELNPATEQGQATEANIDFIIFTVNEPFLGK